MKPDELGKIPQRIYDDLLDNIGTILGYENTGKVEEGKIKESKDQEHVNWFREQKLLKEKEH